MNRKTFDFDWISIILYVLLVIGGWMAIFAVSSTSTLPFWSTNHGKQLMWIGASFIMGVIILSLDNRFLETISYIVYGLSILLLLSVFVIGKEVYGATSWLEFGGVSLQPSEFAKVATGMALAKYMTSLNYTVENTRNLLVSLGIIILPALITLFQNDTGSALVFGSFIIVLYREGLNPLVPLTGLLIVFVCVLTLGVNNQIITFSILTGITLIVFYIIHSKKDWVRWAIIHGVALLLAIILSISTNFIVSKLQKHQQNRIMVLFNPQIDPTDTGYNVIQSKIAIGSGGLIGKGFLQGNYTKYKFVPKQVTDFIFCTVGEEGGWLGATTVIVLFFLLIMRIRYLAEYSKTRYARIYGYSVVSIFFFHVLVNIGMTIGFIPVIGIPLPFFSYGGSAILAFSILFFIMINHYSYRSTILGTKP
ncbi:MAG: rod shape-determining protein RodA [Bacteroidia bacterium]|nr:rod shape-determining protein RodA [Bacteroidia bacterium]